MSKGTICPECLITFIILVDPYYLKSIGLFNQNYSRLSREGMIKITKENDFDHNED
ncbi:hypothetical protein FLGSB24_24720 [Flavobacterium sp. GSB-24]|nr:hypothetical protein FLGSB24_24720 [Flavobacterium sp. GSB-24]